MLSKRLETLTPSYTLEISSKIRQLKNLNLDVIDLSIGEPNFNVPVRAKLYGIESLNNNYTRYDAVTGIKPLKEEIKQLKLLLTTHIRDNLLLCEHCNESHYHIMYGNGEFRCNSCDNVSNIKI